METLSKRLLAAASLSKNEAKIIADIGTDHAFLPVYLIKNNLTDELGYIFVDNFELT